MLISEITRRDALKGIGAAAGMSVLPPKTLARIITPAGTAAPVSGWIWTRLGDRVDQKYLAGLVDRILQSYRLIAKKRDVDLPDETEIKTKLNQVLRKHVPNMDPNFKGWSVMMKDLGKAVALPNLPGDIPDEYADAKEWDDYLDNHPEVSHDQLELMSQERSIRDRLHSDLGTLGKIVTDTNLGDTERYGYKVNHRIKTGEIKPVDYSKPSTSVAGQAAQTVATQIPRGTAASALGSAGAALRNLGSRARDLVTKKAAAALNPDVPRALTAPSTDTEFMRDLQNRVTEPQKQKVDEIALGPEVKFFRGGGLLPRIGVGSKDVNIRPLVVTKGG